MRLNRYRKIGLQVGNVGGAVNRGKLNEELDSKIWLQEVKMIELIRCATEAGASEPGAVIYIDIELVKTFGIVGVQFRNLTSR